MITRHKITVIRFFIITGLDKRNINKSIRSASFYINNEKETTLHAYSEIYSSFPSPALTENILPFSLKKPLP